MRTSPELTVGHVTLLDVCSVIVKGTERQRAVGHVLKPMGC